MMTFLMNSTKTKITIVSIKNKVKFWIKEFQEDLFGDFPFSE